VEASQEKEEDTAGQQGHLLPDTPPVSMSLNKLNCLDRVNPRKKL
jgi:hypothetical protein